ncbi:galactonate dehydratase [Desulfopila sp. IMCC35008]|uniref:galactonate dehydratase n=1 Tax=Desulfopila sp. IMCC35008 TaxID=2653858 RepID=UPI0013D800B5|nr:galactonate dehydratase [Desulfopila sp. IMCC35008]
MKIARYSTFIVPPRWLFLKIETDDGLVGWGEPVIEGKAHTVEAAVHEMMDYVVGRDPSRIEDIWQELYRGAFYRGGPILMSALAGIDQALWDIKGKRLDVPVHDLLGGRCRDRIRVYQWIGGDRPSDVGQAALKAQQSGATAVKMNGTDEMQIVDSHRKIDELVARVAAIRESCGPYFDIGVDFHGRVHKPMARIIGRELEQFNLMFIEEPVLSEHIEELAEIRRHCNIPIATGERMFSRYDFKKLLESGAADIIQPDLSHAGGITECRKIAVMAEAYDVALAPHCPLGPIALAACLQLDAVSYNAFIQEQSLGIHYNQGSDLLDYLKDPKVFACEDGMVSIPEGPGLGIEVDEETVSRMAEEGHRWRNPVWRHDDGSLAEW